MSEVWQNIPGFNDRYIVSSFGRVARVLKIHSSKGRNGISYMKVGIPQTKLNRKNFRVHRLVAITFIPIGNPEDFEVNHKDGNSLNNNIQNLEWCTHSDNVKDSYKRRKNK